MTIEVLRADLLAPARHGFFTRKGGASSGIFQGLNCGPGSGDQAELVRNNRARAADWLDLGPDALLSLHQIHSADVVTVTQAGQDRPQADAMVSAVPGLGLGILTADCAPVLFHDPQAGVIGAAHAGWKGALTGVLEATLVAMEGLGADRAHTRAAIGPTISQRAYQVGPEFVGRFLDEDPDYDRYFAGGEGDRAQFDLPSFALTRLRAAGVGQAEWTGHCTYSDPARFYSYRRATHANEADYGRLISIIRL